MAMIPMAKVTALIGPCAFLFLAACSNELILEGERFPVRPVVADAVPGTGEVTPITLPPQVTNTVWSHKNGAVGHRIDHPALAANPALAWSVKIGAGDSRRGRIIAAPVIDGTNVYTMDAEATVAATSLSGGTQWRTSLIPDGEKSDGGIGGGLAYDDGRLYAATGFGEVLGLTPGSGEIEWRQALDAPVRGAPAAAGGRVFVVARDDVAFGLDGESGQVNWRIPGAVGGAGVLSGAGPAVRGPLVILPFSSGEIVGALGSSGLQVWTAAISGGRRGLVRALVGDISSDPVIDRRVVYAANQSGRMVSLDRRSGERNWTISEGALGPVWPVAGAVFLVSDEAVLMRLDAATGEKVWTVSLPAFERPRKRRDPIAQFGPVLAGGQLYVAGSDGVLRSFDPSSGAPGPVLTIPGGAAAEPAVARGMMFIVSRDGRLHAYK